MLKASNFTYVIHQDWLVIKEEKSVTNDLYHKNQKVRNFLPSLQYD